MAAKKENKKRRTLRKPHKAETKRKRQRKTKRTETPKDKAKEGDKEGKNIRMERAKLKRTGNKKWN